MKLTSGQRLICERVINVFETGTIKGKYGAISIYKDGPNKIRQITYGRSQTTEYGNLRHLVDMYANAGGSHSDELMPYVNMVGNVALVDNEPFKSLLRRAGNEDPVMWATQDKFFDLAYFQPAVRWADANGFTLPLAMLVIYDSFIHSGRILSFLRSRFPEVPPKQGGDERTWIKQYVDVRNKWLTTHSNPELPPSAYRTRDLLREIKRINWDFSHLPIIANGTPVDDHAPPTPLKLPAMPKLAATELVPFLGEFEDADFTTRIGDAAGEALTATVLGATLDRTGILQQLAASVGVTPAIEHMIAYRDKYRPNSNPRYWAVANFDLHSTKPRLFVFDCVVGAVSKHLCAHGRGSEGAADDGIAETFSNKDGSNCTSLGIYHCDITYIGGHGKSLYLDGLEASNSNARRRHIVMHGADYVSPSIIVQTGRIGRSQGCPAIEMDDVEKVIPALMGGSLLMHWKS